MLRVTLKGLLARKLRLTLTALSITLGVTFVSGTLILTGTINGTIGALYGNVYRHVSFEVQAPGILNIPDALLHRIERLPGVAYANGSVSGYARFVGHNGVPIKTGIEPADGLSYDPNARLSPFQLVKGRAPTSKGDVVMDAATAQKYRFSVGERVKILLPGRPRTFTITGIANFIGAAAVPGATFAAFDLPTAQRLFGAVGELYTVDVLTKPGADRAAVRRSIARLLPPGLQVVSGRTLVAQQISSTNQSLAPLSTGLLVFGLIGLFVGGFTIFNTFSIIVGQRTRELALLRVVGASRRQVFSSVVLEGAMVGVVASGIGLGLGIPVVMGLESALDALGLALPAGPLVFNGGTVVVGLGVGVFVTVVATLNPALRAVRIPPAVAIALRAQEPETSSRRRTLVGGLCAVASLLCLFVGLAGSSLPLTGFGAAATFIAVAMLAPLTARPLAGLVGSPLARVLGTPGRLGRANSMRNPRRTAQGATALMVGLALVSAVAVLGSSLASAAVSSVANSVQADLIITSGSGTFGPTLQSKVSRLRGVSGTCAVYGAQFELRGAVESMESVCTNHLADNVNLRMTAGSAAPALRQGELLVDSTTARQQHLRVGSTVRVAFPDFPKATMRVGGIYQPNALIHDYLVGDPFFLAHFPGQPPGGLLVRGRGGQPRLERAVSAALGYDPDLTVQTRTQFEAQQTASINQTLGLVYALLALAVIIALIGVVNSLLLAVSERTHEIGLLRAVGMSRRQVRYMVRSEAVILSLFGALVGVVLGTGLGAALTYSLRQQQHVGSIVVPVGSLIAFLSISALLGLLAATWPARRAARLNVISAIASE